MGAVIDVIIPVFAIVLLGYALAKAGIFSANTSDGLTRFMFYVAVPAMLFHTLASAELPSEVPWRLLGAFYLPSFLIFALGMLGAAHFLGWSRPEQGIAGISSAYSNMVLLGLPLTVAAFGEAATLPLFLLLAPQSMLLFPTTALVIEIYGRPRQDNVKSGLTLLGKSLGRLLLNPVIMSLALGIIFNLYDLPLSSNINKTLTIISAAAPACALTALGVSLAQYRLRGELQTTLFFVSLKNLVHPALVFVGCMALSVNAEWMKVAVLLAAMPCGINAYIFARTYDLQTAAVTKSIVLSTIVSVATTALLLHFFLPN